MRRTAVVLWVLALLSAAGELPAPRVVDAHGDLLPPGALLRLGKVRFGHGLDQLALSPDGKTIRALRWGVYHQTFDYETGRLIAARTLPSEPVYETNLSRDGRSALFVRRPDGWGGPCQLEVWDLDRGTRRCMIPLANGNSSLFHLSADGQFVAGAADVYGPGNGKSVRVMVWDAGTGAEVGQATIDSLSVGGGWSSAPVFSPDNRFVMYTCGTQGTGFYYCLDRATVKLRWQKTVTGGRFPQDLSDGRLLILGPDLAKAVSWADGEESPVRLPPDFKDSTEVGFAHGGATFLYLAGDEKRRELRAWDWRTGRRAAGVRPFDIGLNAWASAGVTRDTTDVFVIDRGWRRYDLRAGEPVWPDTADAGHTEAVTALVFSADGRTAASASQDMTVRVWDVTAGKPLGQWPAAPTGGYWEWQSGNSQGSFGNNGPPAVDLSADGRRLVFVEPGKDKDPPRLRVIDTRTGRTIAGRAMPNVTANGGNPVGFGRARLSADGCSVWASYGEGDADRWSEAFHTLGRWDLDGDRWRDLGSVRPGPPSRSAAAGGRWLAAGEAYDAGSGRRAFELLGYAYGPLATSPDGRFAAGLGRTATGSEARWDLKSSKEVRVWDARTGSPVARLPWDPPPRPERSAPTPGVPQSPGPAAVAWPRQFALHPTGRWLVIGDLAGVRLWDLLTNRVVHTFPVPNRPPVEQHHGSPATALAITPDGRRLATGLLDGTILFWPVPSPKPTPPKADELPALWADLIGGDPAKGWRAAWRLTEDPAAAVRLVRTNLKPAESVSAADVARLLADVDSPSFRRRELATRRLTELADRVRPPVDAAAKAAGTSPELRQRLATIVSAAPRDDQPLPAWAAAQARAVAVLEHAGTPEAVALLRELAGGGPGAWLTSEAQSALDRFVSKKE